MRQMDSKSVFIKIKTTTTDLLASASLAINQSWASMKGLIKLFTTIATSFLVFMLDKKNKYSRRVFIITYLLSILLSLINAWFLLIIPIYTLVFIGLGIFYYFDVSDYVMKRKAKILTWSIILFTVSITALGLRL